MSVFSDRSPEILPFDETFDITWVQHLQVIRFSGFLHTHERKASGLAILDYPRFKHIFEVGHL